MADLDPYNHNTMTTRKGLEEVVSGFTDWAPEDREWLIQEFIKDMGPRYSSATPRTDFNRWFAKVGNNKAGERNRVRDDGGGYLPGDPRYKTADQRKQESIDAEAAAAQGRTNTINTQLDEFYRQLSQPIDPNDPEIQRVASMAGRSAVGQSFGRGIEGGLSVANTQSAAGSAAADMFQRERERRDALRTQVGGLRASGALSQQEFQQSQQQLMEANRRYQQGLNYEDAMNQYNAGLQQRQGIGGAFGAGLGALGFIGGPVVGAATTSAGMSLGAGAGGLSYGPPPRRRSYSGGY